MRRDTSTLAGARARLCSPALFVIAQRCRWAEATQAKGPHPLATECNEAKTRLIEAFELDAAAGPD
jgi:hypothetical protein